MKFTTEMYHLARTSKTYTSDIDIPFRCLDSYHDKQKLFFVKIITHILVKYSYFHMAIKFFKLKSRYFKDVAIKCL